MMRRAFTGLVLSAAILCAGTACSLQRREQQRELSFTPASTNSGYLTSGTIILSHKIPARPASAARAAAAVPGAARFMPLIGYFPPGAAYLPADNETWLEVLRDSKKLVLRRGNSTIKEIQAEGSIELAQGEYYLQHPQKDPLWYAPDDYFKKRRLRVPPDGDRMRYRRGALGKYALYVTTTFPIHCGPVWTEDVGGLRVSVADLTAIYYMLPRGTPVIVR